MLFTIYHSRSPPEHDVFWYYVGNLPNNPCKIKALVLYSRFGENWEGVISRDFIGKNGNWFQYNSTMRKYRGNDLAIHVAYRSGLVTRYHSLEQLQAHIFFYFLIPLT